MSAIAPAGERHDARGLAELLAEHARSLEGDRVSLGEITNHAIDWGMPAGACAPDGIADTGARYLGDFWGTPDDRVRAAGAGLRTGMAAGIPRAAINRAHRLRGDRRSDAARDAAI